MSRLSSPEEALFADALAQPAVARPTFLERACKGDAALRARLEALLAAHEGSQSLLSTSDAAPLRSSLLPEAEPGDLIGRYKVVRKLGEGGCGVVYLADQEEPVRRPVAVKVIKAGMDTREVIARFSGEQQALARMDHPGIAKVFDAGTTAAGRAYFVMEFVPGPPITGFCDERALPTRARLALFSEVCDAVQHAHLKGIIHRDLKSSNVLVAAQEGRASPARPKVIDFGIAKAIQGRLGDLSLVTSADQFIGTPAYMSPEQVDPGEYDIDPRTDVYSLGVLLYELLTGHLPFDAKILSRARPEELRRIIREVEPPKPSMRFATLGAEERHLLARLRSTDPTRLADALAGDLDWIVMKAMEKDRARRYDSPAAFAADLARYLQDEPVIARPPSRAYRLRKLIRRNRLVFAATTTVAVVLVAGTAVSSWQAVRAREAEGQAKAERAIATDERARAEELIVFIMDDLQPSLQEVGKLAIVEATAKKALDYLARRPPQELSDAELIRHAKTLLHLGRVRYDQVRLSEARQVFGAAYYRAVLLLRRDPRNFEARSTRGQAEGWIGIVLSRLGQSDAAHDWYLRQKATAESLVAAAPDNVRWQRELAEAHHSLAKLALYRRDFAEARESYLSELALLNRLAAAAPSDAEIKPQQADIVSTLGTIAERTGDLAEAVRRYEDQVARYAEIGRAQPENRHWRFKVAEGKSSYASALGFTGQRARALELLAEARVALEELVARDPASRRWSSGLFTTKLREAMVARAAGQMERATKEVEEARAGFEQLVAAEPADRAFPARLALACRLSAELRHAAGDLEATALAARALELGAKFVAKDRQMTPERGECASAFIIAGKIAAAAGNREVARRHWQSGFELLAPHLAGARDWRVLDPAARLALLLERNDEARELVRQLAGLNYHPLQPWPAPGDFPVSSPTNPR